MQRYVTGLQLDPDVSVDSLRVTVQTAARAADHAHLYRQSRPTQPVSGLRPAVWSRWPLRRGRLSRWGRLPPALGRLRQPAETVEFLRIGPADARGPQPGGRRKLTHPR